MDPSDIWVKPLLTGQPVSSSGERGSTVVFDKIKCFQRAISPRWRSVPQPTGFHQRSALAGYGPHLPCRPLLRILEIDGVAFLRLAHRQKLATAKPDHR